jgi:hypothetical protein
MTLLPGAGHVPPRVLLRGRPGHSLRVRVQLAHVAVRAPGGGGVENKQSNWTALIGRTGFDTIPSITDPTLSLKCTGVPLCGLGARQGCGTASSTTTWGTGRAAARARPRQGGADSNPCFESTT